MFDELVECSPGGKKKTNKTWTMLISISIQALVVFILILIPLIYTQALPKTLMSSMLIAPPPPAAPPPPPAATPAPKIVKPVARLIQNNTLMAPREIPKQVNIIKEEAPPPDMGATGGTGVVGGVPGGQTGGVLGGLIGSTSTAAPPPPPPPKAVVPAKIVQGGNVMAAKRIDHTEPTYPPLARQAHISGTVRLHAIISKDGRVTELQVISGHPLLVQAAMDAVRQFRYSPTLLNNEPVAVDTTIDVIFNLGG
ncbi:MAG TPA: energy transducer TonB [Candidatus Acidoferrales bacterium]|nr:energy transducer TonB [Candidatus Acidoferrales bacterium]